MLSRPEILEQDYPGKFAFDVAGGSYTCKGCGRVSNGLFTDKAILVSANTHLSSQSCIHATTKGSKTRTLFQTGYVCVRVCACVRH